MSQINSLLLTNVEYLTLHSVFLYPTLACNPIFFFMLALAFSQKRADQICSSAQTPMFCVITVLCIFQFSK